MSVSVIIPVCGDSRWDKLAEHAAETAWTQTLVPDEVIIERADTVAQARNLGSKRATSERQIFLDADDELHYRYVQAMVEATGDIRRPITQGFYEDGSEEVDLKMLPRMDIRNGNFIVIGAMHRREAFERVGGFSDWPILEDWDLWLSMVRNGATVVDVPTAIYRIGVHPGSRNYANCHGEVYSKIRKKHGCR